MKNPESEPLKRITMRIFNSDVEYLQSRFATSGYNRPIRLAVRALVQRLKKVEALRSDNDGDDGDQPAE